MWQIRASPAALRRALVFGPMLGNHCLADQSPKHTLNHQFLRWNGIRILRVLRLQVWLAVLHEERFERALPVYQRSHDLPRSWLWSVLKHGDVTFANVLSNHGIPDHTQRECVSRWLEPNARNVHRNA